MWADEMLDMFKAAPPAGKGLQLAVMTGPDTCQVNGMQLAAEDLMFADHLLSPSCTAVSQVAPADGGQCSDKSTYLPALKAGDTVLVYQYSETRFLVLERMVTI